MKNRAPAKRVEKISMWRGRDGGRDREREGVDEAHPTEKNEERETRARWAGGNKKTNLFVI